MQTRSCTEKQHSGSNHEENKYKEKKKITGHYCCICDERFSKLSVLKEHAKIDAGKYPLECKFCFMKFDDDRCFKKHKLIHESKETSKADYLEYESSGVKNEHDVCRVCNKNFNSRSELLAHTENSDEPQKCIICSKLFCSISDLRNHKRKHKPKYFCLHCSKTITSLRNYVDHVNRHASKGMSVSYKCAYCSESFDSSKLLCCHNKIHKTKSIPIIPCPWTHCNKKFTCQSRLNQHIKRHNGEKVYLCSRCGMFFSDCILYKKHASTCRQRFFKLICKLCGKECGGYSALKTHTRTHTGEKPYTCDTCGTCFKVSHHLKRHKQTHLKESKKILSCDSSTQTPLRLETSDTERVKHQTAEIVDMTASANQLHTNKDAGSGCSEVMDNIKNETSVLCK